jgi:transcriptional regulator with GAF, ATPase, and Fis domain
VRREAAADGEGLLRFCHNGDPRLPRLEPLLAEALVRHDHPLNTRGLLQLLLLSAESSPEGYLRLTPAVSEAVGLQGPPREAPAAISAEDRAFRQQIERAIEEHGTVKGAAEHLGMDRFKLSRTMGRLGIPKPARP